MKLFLYYPLLVVTFLCNTLLPEGLHVSVKDHRVDRHIGVFKPYDPVLQGIKWGNWGSRPYEYYWASQVVSVANKKVIDLGCGLPSQYNWYDYVVHSLKPSYYVGIDVDDRIKAEIIHAPSYDVVHMDMAHLEFPDKEFDVAYCISTFEHIPYDIFMKTIQETYRVLKDNGLLVITLDEQWDRFIPLSHGTGWNSLEQSLVQEKMFKAAKISFGLPDFLMLIKDYFVLVDFDCIVDCEKSLISCSKTGAVYYRRNNRDESILHSHEGVNSCVSYALLKKRTT